MPGTGHPDLITATTRSPWARQAVATLADGVFAAGRHTVRFDAAHLSAGTYLHRLEAGALVQTHHLTLVK